MEVCPGPDTRSLDNMPAVLETKRLRDVVGIEWLPIVAGLMVLYVPTFYGLAGALWQREDFVHGPIILVIVIWLIWDRRGVLLRESARRNPGLGLLVVILGLVFYVVGRSQEITILEVGALFPILTGVLLAMRGWPALREMWFALLFIVYLVPLPGFFVDAMTLPLRQSVSNIAAQVLYDVGYPIAQDGVILVVGPYQLLVAEACSGLNSMFSLSAVGLLYMYLMRRKNWLHNGLILLSLLPIAFVANIVRVIVLVLITYHFGDAAGQDFVHGFSGVVLFVIALMAVICFDVMLANFLKPRVQVL